MRLNNILAEHSIYSALSGICVGMHLGVNLVEIGSGLANFTTPCGRVSLVPGIKNTLIIDDSYNSSPVSASAALSVLSKIKARRKIAVLGDMLELGGSDKEGHEEVAKKFLEAKGDIFFAVGKRMKSAEQFLKKHNLGEGRIFSFENPMEAGKKLQEIMHEGDLILVKGSQGMRMEKIVEEVMAEPQKAPELLCRQDKKWKERPWEPV
jgi:UDP-N-acetylmuramoyl-tripeptide--D-alanyl-D-alanine ligase